MFYFICISYTAESKDVEITDGPAIEVNFDLKSSDLEKNKEESKDAVPTEPNTLEVLIAHINKLRDPAHREKQTFIEPTVFKHHNYNELESFMKNISQRFPKITRLYSIGKSVQGRELWTIEISDNPGKHEPGNIKKSVIHVHVLKMKNISQHFLYSINLTN